MTADEMGAPTGRRDGGGGSGGLESSPVEGWASLRTAGASEPCVRRRQARPLLTKAANASQERPSLGTKVANGDQADDEECRYNQAR